MIQLLPGVIDMEIKEIIELYEKGYSTTKIAHLAGYKTAKSIGDKLKANGVRLRTSAETKELQKGYSNNLFAKIDSEWKAYYLGLLLTDGWVTQGDTVGLSSVDKDQMEYISAFTGKGIQVVEYDSLKLGPNSQPVNRKTQYKVVLRGRQLVKDLKRLGIVERKTFTLQGPELYSDELIYLKDIVRGIIDGDGTLGVPTNVTGSIYFRIVSASKDFLLWCIWALQILGMRDIKPPRFNGNIWEITSGKPENIAILASTIYGSKYGLQRKAEKIRKHFFKHTSGRLARQLAM